MNTNSGVPVLESTLVTFVKHSAFRDDAALGDQVVGLPLNVGCKLNHRRKDTVTLHVKLGDKLDLRHKNTVTPQSELSSYIVERYTKCLPAV